jgi:carboxyl-terminal processing protease
MKSILYWFVFGCWLSVGILPGEAGAQHSVSNAAASADVVIGADIVKPDRNDAYRQMELLTEVMLLVRKYHVDEHEFDELVYAALDGMLHSLDAHSSFLDADEYKAMQDSTRGEYGGIGVKVGVRKGILTVIAPIEESPGFKAGLQTGDKLLKIDSYDCLGIPLGAAVKKMRGAKGTKVTLSVLREGETEPRTIEVVRDEIEVSSVKGARMLTDQIGYVRITQFSAITGERLRKALQQLDSEGMDALVLDLRGNPGGLLNQAVAVAEIFLKKGELIVATRGRAGVTKDVEHRAAGKVHFRDLPLVVLINGGSASASEIVAGAVQDHKRGILIGEKSYGKGSVQSIIPSRIDAECAIRLTTAYYYTPAGRMINNVGLEPDIKVELSPADWHKIQLQRLHRENPSVYRAEATEADKDVVDRQLERSVDLLKSILIFKKRN